MEIRKVKYEEYEELIALMDLAFNMQGDDRFEHLLPKLYYKDNKDMLHYAIFIDNKMVASIGLYKMTFINKKKTLNVGCIGAVSTHPDYRKNGYFTILMKKVIAEAKRLKYDLLFLGGNRTRYSHFNFENAGRKLVLNVSQRSLAKVKAKPYSVSLLNKDNKDDINECLKLYNRQAQHVNRTITNFYNHLVSWNCIPYVVKVDNKIIGYYSLKNENNIYEFVYNKAFQNEMYKATLNDKKDVIIQTSMKEYNNDTLNKVDWFNVEHCEMYNVLNFKNVCNYLGFDESKANEFNKLSKKEKIRKLLGSAAYPSLYAKDTMFIFTCDQG